MYRQLYNLPQNLGFINEILTSNISVRETAYKMLVRPQLEYAYTELIDLQDRGMAETIELRAGHWVSIPPTTVVPIPPTTVVPLCWTP